MTFLGQRFTDNKNHHWKIIKFSQKQQLWIGEAVHRKPAQGLITTFTTQQLESALVPRSS